jgi:superfamily II DNA/RNA helicase
MTKDSFFMASYKYSVYNSKNRGRGNRGRSGGNRNNKRRGEYINPSRFVQVAKPVAETQYSATHNFSDFQVASLIHDNLTKKGYKEPSPIQDQTIPLALSGSDIIGIANTGTGKTAAFAVPVLNSLINNSNSKALIVAPTRELAQQIEEECRSIGKGGGFYGALLIGGTKMGPQLKDLKNNPRIVIGTPGRIMDHMKRKTLNLSAFNIVVLDEVDRMLDMGFVNDMTEILNAMAVNRQSLFFSATMDTRVQNLIGTFSNNPKTVSVKSGDSSENVHQDIVRFTGNFEKIDERHNILIDQAVEKAIVFDQTSAQCWKNSVMS